MMLFMWGFLIGHRGRVACAGEIPHFITFIPAGMGCTCLRHSEILPILENLAPVLFVEHYTHTGWPVVILDVEWAKTFRAHRLHS